MLPVGIEAAMDHSQVLRALLALAIEPGEISHK